MGVCRYLWVSTSTIGVDGFLGVYGFMRVYGGLWVAGYLWVLMDVMSVYGYYI